MSPLARRLKPALRAVAAAAALLLVPVPARADPALIYAFVVMTLESTALAAAAYFVAANATLILFSVQVFGAMDARRKARAATNAARNAYNASLSDRNVSALRADPPLRAIYGRCITGGSVVAILTSDKQGVRDDGSTYTKADAYKHLVIVLAAREVQAIHEVLIDGVAVGALDANGWATTGDTVRTLPAYREITLAAGAAYTAGAALTSITAWEWAGTTTYTEAGGSFIGQTVAYSLSNAGKTVTNNSAFTAVFSMQASETQSRVRISKLLGTPGQAADPWLLANVPDQWTAADRLRGLAAVVVTLDLEDGAFQGGPPAILVDVSGHKLFDPRTGTTTWSANPPLVVRDYLISEIGFACVAADIDDAYVMAAANACDAAITLDGAAAPTYSCHGTVTSDDGREAVLDDLAECMAGQIAYGAAWQVMCGAWAPSVMDLTEDDLHGQIEVVQAGAGIDDIFNGLRVRHIPAGSAVVDEPVPYQNTAFVAADNGVALWSDIELPYTNHRQRCANIARVLTERARASQVLRVPCKLKAWPLQLGDRVRLSSAEYGISAAYYRVTDWQFGLKSPVTLTLQADAPGIYDLADATTAAVTPPNGLPSPWVAAAITGLLASSGTLELLRRSDGTVETRIRLAWARINDPYINDNAGSIEVRWRRPRLDAVNLWQTAQLTGGDTGTWLGGVAEGDLVVIQVEATNRFGVSGGPAIISHTVVGKDAPPSNVATITWAAEEFGVRLAWPVVSDADVDVYELRTGGASWEAAAVLDREARPGWLWRVQTAGARTVWVKARDTTGHYSAAAASALVTVPAPSAPVLAWALDGLNEALSWATPASSYAIDRYELRFGTAASTWATATYLDATKAASRTQRVGYLGQRRYFVAAVDAAGNVGAAAQLDVYINAPGAPTAARAEVVDNNALLYWAAPSTGSLPVERYEVRKGATWAAGTVVGSNGNSTFAAVFEQSAGVYTYWVAAFDQAGNVGPAAGIIAAINQPPDYILRVSWASDLSGARTNLALDAGTLVGPTDTTETWAGHFSSRGWASPQDQVNAGFGLYLQPSVASASYDETFDYGAVLAATTVTATLASAVLAGAVAAACQIYTKLLVGDAWAGAPAGATSVLASNFRYVRVVYTLTCSAGANLVRISGLTVKLSAKLRTDSGAGTAAVGGTWVPFTLAPAFVAADTPQVQPNGAALRIATVAYAGGVNPTGFTVTLYNLAGTDVGGAFSWTARGY